MRQQSSEPKSDFDVRVERLFQQNMNAHRVRADRVFVYVMAGQWIFGIILALVLSPSTWAGKVQTTHVHVYTAVFLGGLISALPIALTFLRPGAPVTRHTIAVAQMLWSALLIHLTGGRIETHFHVFGSLAFLAFYYDWMVLIPATVTVAADHFFRGLLWPESVYGITNPEWWRFLEHAFWVVFEDIVLIMYVLRGLEQSRAISRPQVELEILNTSIEHQVQERTRELAASREQYRSLLETTLAVPWELDPDLVRFTYVGPQAEGSFGYPANDWLGDGFLIDHVHSDDRSLIPNLGKMAQNGKAEVEFRLRAQEGHWIWVRNIINLVNDANGKPVLRGIMLDITERRTLETELAQAQKLESVGRLASGVAHEINTPIQFVGDSVHFVRDTVKDLSGLLGKYQTLNESFSSGKVSAQMMAEIAEEEQDMDLPFLLEETPKALDRALEGLDRVAVIVRSMKEFAHPDQKEKTAANLNQAIASTLTIASNEYKYVAEVETDFGELPLVRCHVGEINQAVLNIVVNAAHAIADSIKGSDTKGQIRLKTRHDGNQVVIAIADTGGGIPDDIRDKIFDPFFTTKEVGRGTGQGLAIARSVVVDKHGGTLEFHTEVGQGTTFFIRLPIDFKPSEAVA